jgi:ubiquinone/menaquinone biosynthesis C-methylase UbiE
LSNLSNEKRGLHYFLKFSFVYDFIQNVLGSKKLDFVLVNEYIKPSDGQNILDFGCGTGKIVKSLHNFSNIKYFGIEPNAKYVIGGKNRYSQYLNVQFYTGSLEVLEIISEKFDTIIVSAVLHHLHVESWSKIINTLYKRLKPGGKIVLLDNVFHPNQNLIAKFLIRLDRGISVVSIDQYLNLIDGNYSVNYDLRTDLLNVPYSHVITTIK